MAQSVFEGDGGEFAPTDHARGPWDPQALHGGAPAALMTTMIEREQDQAGLSIAFLNFQFLRPIPFAPLQLRTHAVRGGRRVREIGCELCARTAQGHSEPIARASALYVQAVPDGLPAADPAAQAQMQALEPPPLAPPDSGTPLEFTLDGSADASFAASAMEMRWLSDPHALGPGRVWMRLRRPLLAGQAPSALARLVAAADFGNGVSAALPFAQFLFINADLTIHLWRPPRGEWIGLHARTLLHAAGSGLSETVLHDEHGAVGRALQTLVVQPR